MSADDQTLSALQGDRQLDESMSNEIKLFSDGITETLKRQLEKYLTGILSAPTPALFEATKYAPLNNMAAEGTLGMVDAQLRRAPNAQIDLISAKVKSIKNGTVQWVRSQSPEIRRKIVRSAVKQKRTAMLEQKQRKAHVLHVLNQRLYEAVQKQAIKKTREMEKEVSPFIEKGENLTIDDMEEKYPDIEPDVANRASQMCSDPSSITGLDLSHLWFDEDKCQWDLYCGSVCDVKVSKRKNKQKETIITHTYTIEYWLPGCPEDSHKSLLTLTQLVADVILGDLVFT